MSSLAIPSEPNPATTTQTQPSATAAPGAGAPDKRRLSDLVKASVPSLKPVAIHQTGLNSATPNASGSDTRSTLVMQLRAGTNGKPSSYPQVHGSARRASEISPKNVTLSSDELDDLDAAFSEGDIDFPTRKGSAAKKDPDSFSDKKMLAVDFDDDEFTREELDASLDLAAPEPKLLNSSLSSATPAS